MDNVKIQGIQFIMIILIHDIPRFGRNVLKLSMIASNNWNRRHFGIVLLELSILMKYWENFTTVTLFLVVLIFKEIQSIMEW